MEDTEAKCGLNCVAGKEQGGMVWCGVAWRGVAETMRKADDWGQLYPVHKEILDLHTPEYTTFVLSRLITIRPWVNTVKATDADVYLFPGLTAAHQNYGE